MGELYSHSRLSSFESCPRKFQYRYVLKLPSEAEGIEGFVGKRVHEVLERLHRVVSDGHLPSLERVIRRFERLWEEHYDAVRVRIVRDLPAAWYRAWGVRCLANYYRANYPFDRDETLGLEEPVVFALDAASAYRVRGVIDRIARSRDGTLEIHDYKTSQRVPRQQELDRDRQLALYQIGVAARFAARRISLVWHYVGSGQVRRSERTPEQLAALRRETMERIDQSRAEAAFEPRPGPLCAWCEYADRCPAGPSARAAEDDAGVVPPRRTPGPERPTAPAAPRPLQLPLLDR